MLTNKNLCALIAVLVAFSCKSSKTIVTTENASEKYSAKQIIKAHQDNYAKFKTLQSKLKIEIKEGNKSNSLTFGFRMEKDKAIWLNAPLGLARMYITPNKVQFYNKTDNTFFDGNYKLLSKYVGIDLDFQKVQAILLGQTLTNLNPDDFNLKLSEKAYNLEQKQNNTALNVLYLINASHFKLNSVALEQKSKQRSMKIDYTKYQKIETVTLPQTIKIEALETNELVAIDLEFESVKLNEEVRFPFSIPSGYKEITID